MDALSIAAPSALPNSEKSSAGDQTIRLSAQMRAALTALLEAFDYAQDLGVNPWDFALEITTLRRFKLSNSDLRWLVGRGLAEHGVEVTLPGQAERAFQHPERLQFSKKTCLVLTPAGAELAREISHQGPACDRSVGYDPLGGPALAIAPPASTPVAPKWDRDRLELRVGSTVVRQFKIPSASEEMILAAFEESHWPPRIDDPLSAYGDAAASVRLPEAIDSLNRNQKHALLRFQPDGSGIAWKFRNGAGPAGHEGSD